MLDIPHVVLAEGRRQSRYHAWVSRIYCCGALLTPLLGSALATVSARQPGTAVPLFGLSFLTMCATVACVLGQRGGRHAAASEAFARVASGPHTDPHFAVHDLNQAYTMTEKNDLRDSSVTVRVMTARREQSMDEIRL